MKNITKNFVRLKELTLLSEYIYPIVVTRKENGFVVLIYDFCVSFSCDSINKCFVLSHEFLEKELKIRHGLPSPTNVNEIKFNKNSQFISSVCVFA